LVAKRLRLGYPGWAWTSPARGCSTASTARSARRLELLERLEAEGATLDELRGAVDDGLLVFLPAERLVDGPPRHRARDVARQTGVSIESLAAMRRAHGLPVPPRRPSR
jgi:hypothetical protein